MSPDDINEEAGRPVYCCRVCKAGAGLQWFNGTSCPVCHKPECARRLWAEWDATAAVEAKEPNHDPQSRTPCLRRRLRL